jgi:N-methylhydantoinase A
VIINTQTEHRGAVTALLATRGFRDVLEITSANRPDLYNILYRKPKPFVPRRLRLEVADRSTTRTKC